MDAMGAIALPSELKGVAPATLEVTCACRDFHITCAASAGYSLTHAPTHPRTQDYVLERITQFSILFAARLRSTEGAVLATEVVFQHCCVSMLSTYSQEPGQRFFLVYSHKCK
jgi:hypothetical protein